MDPKTPTELRQRVGTSIGDAWRITLLLAAGNSSAVYLAKHRSGAMHAVKVLHTSIRKDDRERFQREFSLVPKIEHPSLVPVFASGIDDDGNPYFVMDFIEGWTLREMILRGVWRLSDLLNALTDLLDALAAIHAAGVVHRDLKPENILIDEHGRVRLLDFGIAKDPTQPLTAPGAILGTVSYMAPEQARGEEATAKSDVYGVSAIVFRILVGRPVHTGVNATARLWNTGTIPPPRIDEIDKGLPSALAAWVMKGLSFDPADRFDSAREMREELRRVHITLTRAERGKELIHDAGEGEPTVQRFHRPASPTA
jgi:eukaryotic-like serine/threonine-protein kinase